MLWVEIEGSGYQEKDHVLYDLRREAQLKSLGFAPSE